MRADRHRPDSAQRAPGRVTRLDGKAATRRETLCGPVSGKCELKTLDAVAASRVACAGPMLSAGGRALLD